MSFKESLQNFKLISFITNSLFVLIIILLYILLLSFKFIFIEIPFWHSIIGTKPIFAIIDSYFISLFILLLL